MNNEYYNENENNEQQTPPDTPEVEPVSEIPQEPEEKKNSPETEPEMKDTPRFEERTYTNPAREHPKRRRTPTWAIALICVIGALYLIISAALIAAFIKISPNFTNTLKNEIIEEVIEEEPKIKEHLFLQDSPVSEGAKTTDDALTVKQISKKVRNSVVGVTCQNAQSFSASSVGSGIIMSADGYIITNNHVIEGMTTIDVVLDDGTTYPARLIGSDVRSDLAVIKVNATDLPAAEFGDSDKLEQGDPAIAIGNPAGLQLQNTVTSGIISAINRDIVVEDRTMTLIQTDASINPGNSGGPLVNEFGQVIGINTVKVGISYYEGLGFAIPINTAKPIIDELISNGYIKGRPSIGITGQSITARDAAFYGLPEGIYIEYVHPHSDAFKKGLRRGDVITKMNGTKLSSSEEIKRIRDNFKAGDEVTITIYRNGTTEDVKIILMDEATLSSTSGTPS